MATVTTRITAKATAAAMATAMANASMRMTMAMVQRQRWWQRQQQWQWRQRWRQQRQWRWRRQWQRCRQWRRQRYKSCCFRCWCLCLFVVDVLEIIVIWLLLACGSGVKIFFRFFCYMHKNNFSGNFFIEQKYKRSALSSTVNQYQCSLWYLFQMFLLNFLNETYIHNWELVVPLFLVVMFCWTSSNPTQCRINPKVLQVGYLLELFS